MSLAACLLLAGCESGPGGGTPGVRPSDSASNPDVLSSPAHINTELGLEYMKAGNRDAALARLLKALEYDPNFVNAHVGLGILYENFGEKTRAEQHYQRALGINAQDTRIRNNYGQFLCRAGRHQEAQAQFDVALSNPLNDAPYLSYTFSGLCALTAKDAARATAQLGAALQSNAQFVPALMGMVKAFYELGQHAAAREYLQRYYKTEKHSPDSLWYGVLIERAMGNREAEVNYAVRLKGLFPDTPQARQLREMERQR
jgi:type IV pilus assembly protein PilF